MGARLVRLDSDDSAINGHIIDVIDTSDPSLIFVEGQLLGNKNYQEGGAVKSDSRIFVNRKPNAIDFVVDDVIRIAGLHGKIGLLRFHGHGLPGYQAVWSKVLSPFQMDIEIRLGLKSRSETEKIATKEYKNPVSRVGISKWNLASITPSISRLRHTFAAGAEVWLMGCRVGAGKDGMQLAMGLALRLGVIVKAGSDNQRAGIDAAGAFMNYLHEGPVVVGRPGG